MENFHNLFGVRCAVQWQPYINTETYWLDGYFLYENNHLYLVTNNSMANGSQPETRDAKRFMQERNCAYSWDLDCFRNVMQVNRYLTIRSDKIKPLKLNEGVTNEGKICVIR